MIKSCLAVFLLASLTHVVVADDIGSSQSRDRSMLDTMSVCALIIGHNEFETKITDEDKAQYRKAKKVLAQYVDNRYSVNEARKMRLYANINAGYLDNGYLAGNTQELLKNCRRNWKKILSDY